MLCEVGVLSQGSRSKDDNEIDFIEYMTIKKCKGYERYLMIFQINDN